MNNEWLSEIQWTAAGYGLIAAVVIVALLAFGVYLRISKTRLLPLSRLRPGNWTGYEVFSAFFFFLVMPTAIPSILLSIDFYRPLIGVPPADDSKQFGTYVARAIFIASPLTLAMTLGLLFLAIYMRSQTRPRNFGLSWARWPANFAVGGAAFLVTTPIVLGLHALLTMFRTAENPVIELARQIEPWEWFLLGFQAIVQAPILEEVVFRGILLGWLRRASLSGHLAVASMTIFVGMIRTAEIPGESTTWTYVGPGLFSAVCAGGYCLAMYRMTRTFRLNDVEIQNWNLQESPPRVQLRNDWQQQNARLAIFGSAMLFATFHTHDWPAPIALLLFGIALGWLATRTQSLLPSITLHMLFNLVAFITLYGTTLVAPPQNGNAATTAVRPSVFGSTTSSVPGSQLPLRK